MANHHRSALQQACVTWLDQELSWDIALTLNFRAGIQRDQATQAAKQFWQRVDCAVYGAKVKRKGLRVPRVCVLEGDGHMHNHHYHAAVHLPTQRALPEFQQFLRETWQSFQEAGRFTHVEARYGSQQWLHYMCKRMTHSTDVLCVATSHILV